MYISDDLGALRELNAAIFMNISVPPSVDNYVLTDTLDDIYMNKINESLELNVDKLIIGFNSLDSGLSFPFYEYMVPTLKRPSNGDELKQYLDAYIPNSTQVELLQTIYYPIDNFPGYSYQDRDIPSYELLWATINADVCQICPAMLQIELLMDNNIDVDIHLYNFLGAAYPYYIPHGAELPFLFNQSEEATDFWGVEWSYNLSYFFTETWVNYAIYGNPNSTVYPNQWLSYQNNGIAMSIQNDSGIILTNYYTENYRNGVCAFWMEEIGMNISQNLCYESIAVSLNEGDEDNKLETWEIVSIIVVGMLLLVVVIWLMYRHCHCNKNKDRFAPYSFIADNEMPKYGSS